MNPMAIASLVLVAVGILLIILGAWMSVKEWKTKHEGQIKSEAHALHESLGSLAKVLDAIKDYPAGQKLIVFGIIILIIAGLFGGISGL
jgi:uncharacterized membrane protein